MQLTIELKKHENKDYTMHIYEGSNYFVPILSIKKPMRWNKIITNLGQFLESKKMINIFQKKALEENLKQQSE
jgi:hypothetical protein